MKLDDDVFSTAVKSLSTPQMGPQQEDPFSVAARAVDAPTAPVNSILDAAAKANPAQAAQAAVAARKTQLPLDVVKRNNDLVQQQLRAQGLSGILAENPAVYKMATEKEGFAEATSDDWLGFNKITKAVKSFLDGGALKDKVNVKNTVGIARDVAGGAAGMVGGTLSGLAEGIDIGARAIDRPIRQALGDDIANMFWFDNVAASPTAGLKTIGGGWKALAETVGTDDKTFVTDVAKGLGQLGSQLGLFVATRGGSGAAQMATLAAQGVDQMAQKIATDVPATSAEADTAKILGAGVTAVTEKFGLDLLLDRVPPTMRSNVARWAVDKAYAFLGEASQEIVENIGQDAVRKLFTNKDATIGDGALYEGSVAGTAAALVRAALGLRKTTMQVDDAERGNQHLTDLFKLATETRTFKDDPQTLAEFINAANEAEGAPESIFVDKEVFAQAMQKATPEEFARVSALIEAQDATTPPGGTYEIPIGDFTAAVAGSSLEQVLLQEIRTTPDGLSMAEAKATSDAAQTLMQENFERVIQQAADSEALRTSAETVKAVVLDQLKTAGRFKADVNDAYATLVRDFYTATAARVGMTPEQLYAKYPLRVVAESPLGGEVLNKDEKTGALTVEGYHYSAAARPFVSTSMFGTGLQGSGREQYQTAADERLRKRAYFYVDKGTGINPESGVGGVAQKAKLSNVYDADADPLRLNKGDRLAFESAVLDAGFSGYLNRLDGTQSGQVVLLGDQNIKTDPIGPAAKLRGEVVPPPRQRASEGRDKVVDAVRANKALPTGSPMRARWAEILEAQMPAEFAAMRDAGVFDGPNESIYRDGLLKDFESMTEAPVYRQSRVKNKTPAVSKLLKSLTPEEQAKVTDRVADKIIERMKDLPSSKEMAATAYAGRAKRGWYKESAEAISAVFGHDGPRFAALLAAMSPQTPVENNLFNALSTWRGWIAAGRPTGRDDIINVMARNVMGSKLTDSVLPAWINNSVRALTAEDPTKVVLSGPKVNSFFKNLIGVVEEVTNDAWMANYALVDQTIFKGGLNAAGTDPGKSTGYLAMNARVREAAATLTKLTGETWVPAEVQETIWSWAKTLYEAAESAGENRTARQIVEDGALTDELINSTPDFSSLFYNPTYQKILREAGYGEQLDALGATNARQSGQEPGTGGQAAPFDGDTQRRLELQAARRLERLAENRGDASAAAAERKLEQYLTEANDAALSAAETEDAGFSDPGGMGGGDVVLAQSPRPNPVDDVPLEGLPATVKVNGTDVTFGPFAAARDAARGYMAKAGLPYSPPTTYAKVDEERATRIAAAFDAMPHAPEDPEVKAAYDAMIRETIAQWEAIKATGLQVEFITGDDPYGNPRNAILDVVNNNHLWVYPTSAGFGGSESANVDVSGNPLLAVVPGETISGRPVQANDIFRIVHDYFGHIKEGVGFRAEGEENAWRAHSSMYSPLARRAMTTETRGQNSWVNYGPFGQFNKTAGPGDTQYAPQKIGLLPQWVVNEGASDVTDGPQTITDKDGNAYNLTITPQVFGAGNTTPNAVMVEVRDPATGQRRGFVDFALKGGNVLQAENALVAQQYRGKGLAEAMYRAARAAGYQIEPGRVQTDDGKGMVASLQSKGVLGQSQTDTAAFKKWFGDSKVVDAQGKPMVVYHGGTFGDPGNTTPNANKNRAFWVTPSKKLAAEGYQRGGNLTEMYTNIKNPADLTAMAAELLLIYNADTELMSENPDAGWTEADGDIADNAYLLANSGDVLAHLTKLGYDSLTVEENPGVWSFGILDPRNVKSAIGNDGTFDANDPSILSQGPRGTFNPKTLELTLLANADLSTFLHESGHFFLEVMADIASQPNAPAGIQQDMEAILGWFGVTDLFEWNTRTLDQKRPYHEKFAESFEQYLLEGKAPSTDMAPVFARFRSWMVSVYKSLKEFVKGRNLQLSDEVRSVFDRLIATEEQIAEAERVAGYTALFASAKEAGMTDEEFAAYQAKGQEATDTAMTALAKRSIADMKWAVNARAKALREAQKSVDEKRKAMREEVAAEVKVEPVYAVQRWLKTGVMPDGQKTEGGKLSTAALREMYGDSPAAPWRYLATNMISADPLALHPDVVAGIFDYDSGDAMVRDIVGAFPEDQQIDGKTDQRLLETYGDLVTEQGIQRAANEAVHNEARARFVATEMKALAEGMNAREQVGIDKKGRPLSINALVKAAQMFADNIVARRRIRDLKPSLHTSAETRAAKAAEKAVASGDTQGALKAKRDQLLNHYAAKKTLEAQDEVVKAVEYLKKFDKSTVRAKLPPEYTEQIDALLERFDLRVSTSGKTIDKRASLREWIASQEELGLSPVIPDYLLEDARLTSYKEMTVEEFRGLVDSVKNIEHLGRLKSKLLTLKDKREFAVVVNEISALIQDNGGKPKPPPRVEKAGFMTWLRGAWAEHRKLDSLVYQMAGGQDNTLFFKAFIQPMNDAGANEQTMVEQATEKLRALYAPIIEGQADMSKGAVFVPEINQSLPRGARIAVALNWGNPQNRQRLQGGDGWNDNQINAIISTLTPQELAFVNNVWELIDSYWPEVKAKQLRVTGVAEDKVEPMPFEATANDGTKVQMRGGYYPIKYDRNLSFKAEQNEAAELAKDMMRGAFGASTTRRGHTKARVDEVTGMKVKLDLDVITQHITQVVHDLAWHEWVIDANRLLRAPQIATAIRDYYGIDTLNVMKNAVEGIATEDMIGRTRIDNALLLFRSNISRSVMGLSLTTALLQPFGLTQSMSRIGVGPVLRGARRWAGDAAHLESSMAWIGEKSDFMRLRSKTFNRELREINASIGGKSKLMQGVDGGLFWMMQKMQMIADVPTWIGAYEKAQEDGLDEVSSVALADAAVLSAQGGGTIKDMAVVQRKHPLLTQFYSYFSTTLNLTVQKTATTDFKNPKAVAGWLGDMALLLVVPAILPALLIDALRGGLGDDEPEEIATKIAKWQLAYAMGLVVGVRELGGAVAGFDYAGPPAGRIIADIGKAGQQTVQADVDEPLVMAYVRLMGSAFGIPTVQAVRSYKGWVAWEEGKAPPTAVLLGPPPKE